MKKNFNITRTHIFLSVLLLIVLFSGIHVFASSGTSSGFVSMTKFPAFKQASGSAGLGAFINILYTYLIGIAAVLAILEIIWGGFLWMGSGASVTNKSAGKNKITKALLGLTLVLSPVIIFSIINPQMLSLRLGSSKLTTTSVSDKKSSICSDVHGTYYSKKADCTWGNVLGDGSNQVCVLVVGGGACGIIVPNGSLIFFAQYSKLDKKTKCTVQTTRTFLNKQQCKKYYSQLDFNKTGDQKITPTNNCNIKLVPDTCP
ncbi:MAG TPA: hypothetical protein ENJ75_01595 [Candidatus Kaiserbacteria bacterium]|nr:hypothetical protein [Candidatus Kaiserbacteria bacterium]